MAAHLDHPPELVAGIPRLALVGQQVLHAWQDLMQDLRPRTGLAGWLVGGVVGW